MGASDLRGRLGDYNVLDALHRLPDGVALTTDEAAIFLRVSVSTLERQRRDGSGPPYLQGGKKGAKGVNQKCLYQKGDLIKYQESQRVQSTMGAAVRRGQAYMPFVNPTPKRTSFDLYTKKPFYFVGDNCLDGCIDDTPLDVILERIGKRDIVWLQPIHAATLSWTVKENHICFADSVRSSLLHAMAMLDTHVPT